jgi:dUTP pyrophosphatase
MVYTVEVLSEDGSMPFKKQTPGANGHDVCNNGKYIMLLPQETVLIPTGIYLAVPEGVDCQIRPRSGLCPVIKWGYYT